MVELKLTEQAQTSGRCLHQNLQAFMESYLLQYRSFSSSWRAEIDYLDKNKSFLANIGPSYGALNGTFTDLWYYILSLCGLNLGRELKLEEASHKVSRQELPVRQLCGDDVCGRRPGQYQKEAEIEKRTISWIYPL